MAVETVSIRDLITPNFYGVWREMDEPEVTEVLMKGGRSSRKSTTVGTKIFAGLTGDPQAHAVIGRRYSVELRNTVFALMQRVCSRMKLEHIWRFTVSPMRVINVKTGQMIIFDGFDDPDKSKSTEMPFGYVKYLWLEEADQYGGMEDIRKVKQSFLRGEGGHRLFIMTWNPPRSGRSWINQEAKVPKKGRVVHHSTSYEVPDSTLGEVFVTDREHLRQVNEQAWRHEYMGEEVGNGLEVFKNVELREFSDEECATFTNVRQGLDWGYAVDPVALVRASYDRKRRTLTIFGERSGIGVGNRELDDMTPDDWKDTHTYADSAEPKSIDEMRNEYGWKITPAAKGPGSVNRGVKWLAELEKIVIDPTRCPRSAKEFMNYSLEVRKGGEVISDYPDKDNHCIAGSSMIETLHGMKSMRDVEPMDFVLTRNGWHVVTDHWSNGIRDTVLINGKLKATSDHSVFFNGSFSPIDTMRYGDILLEAWNQKKLNIEGSGITATRIDRVLVRAVTSNGLLSFSTGKYGKTTMGRFLRGCTSIIRTGIMVTIALKILNYWTRKGTCKSIVNCGLLSGSNGNESTLKGSDHSQRNGMLQKTGGNGIANTARNPLQSEKRRTSLARIAGSLSSHLTIMRNIVQTLAVLLRDENLVLTMKRGFVSFVVKNTGSIATPDSNLVLCPVVQFQHIGQEEVFDMTVSESHEFFADGILVHNCIDSARYCAQEWMAPEAQPKPVVRNLPTVSHW